MEHRKSQSRVFKRHETVIFLKGCKIKLYTEHTKNWIFEKNLITRYIMLLQQYIMLLQQYKINEQFFYIFKIKENNIRF